MRIAQRLAVAATLALTFTVAAATVHRGPAARAAVVDATPGVVATATATASPVVDTKNFAYAPDSLTISPGTTVTFRNSDEMAHTVTASDGSFDSGNMDRGKAWSHTFTKAGTYAYTCAYHSYMRGKIIVK